MIGFTKRSIAMMTTRALTATLLFAAAAAQAVPTGDCNPTDGQVKINEVQACVNIFSGIQDLSTCVQCDQDGNQLVKINEVQAAVNCFSDVQSVGCLQVVGGPTNTPTLTPVVATPTKTVTVTPTITPTPIVVTNTPVSTATNTPTRTLTNTPAATPTNTGLMLAVCGNGMTESPEECDDGGTCVGPTNFCFGGTRDTMACTLGAPDSDPMGCPSGSCHGIHCTDNSVCGGGVCTPFGGDGCANNCTIESTATFTFSGANCVGGAKNGQTCTFIATCVGGSFPGKSCDTSNDCGISPNQGVCTSECTTAGDGGNCYGVGVCTAGDAPKIGTTCPSAVSPSVPPPPVTLCQGGTKNGVSCAGPLVCANDSTITCTTNADCTPSTCVAACPSGTCVNPCGTNGVCEHRSGASLQAIGTLIQSLGVGPISGSQTIKFGKAGTDGRIPVAIPAAGIHFEPIRVPGLACACVRGIAVPEVHGPGNSASGYIGCGAGGLAGVNFDNVIDHNTTPANIKNGPGTCTAGARAGLGCGLASDCPGGACGNEYKGGGLCVTGVNRFKVCKLDADCPGSICASPDDATCSTVDPAPPVGSGAKTCLETKSFCTSGPNPGKVCTTNINCGNGNFCGNACNPVSLHPNICNSPRHFVFSGNGARGSALIVNSTAIGTIATPDDLGTCSRASVCTKFTLGGVVKQCLVDAECPAGTGSVCSPAYCAGKCAGGANVGKACVANSGCPASTCTVGTDFAKPCNGTAGSCAATNICTPVSIPKGFDGLPCTDDDSVTSRGTLATTPTTTGIASSGIVDADDATAGANPAGKLIFGGLCTGLPAGSPCVTQSQGHLFNCDATPGTPAFVQGAKIVTGFPNLDQNIIQDNVVTSGFTAR